MKISIIRFLALAFALLMICLSLFACGKDDNSTPDDTASLEGINGVSLDKFTIVHSDDEYASQRAISLKNSIKLNLGCDLPITTGETETEYEIIVGNVDREITKEFYASDYKYYNKYRVEIKGSKMAILANNDITLGLALKALTAKYFFEGATMPTISDADSFEGDIYDNKQIAINRRINGTDIRIASNNIYFHQKDTKTEEDDYEYRKTYLLQNFALFDADILMLQEASYDRSLSPTKKTWRDIIDPELEGMGYTYVPANPKNKLLESYTPIWYRADRVELVDSKFFMYSSVKEMPDSSISFSKSYTMAVFTDKTTSEKFACISTHFTWAGDEKTANRLRKQDATEVIEEVKALRETYGNDLPIILMGDLNCTTGGDPYKILDAELDNVLNTEGIVRKNALYGTTHNLGSLPNVGGGVIDHTLISGSGYKAVQYHHVINNWSSKSTDHIPLIVDIDLTVE